MTGLVRKATLLTVCGLLAASAALANVPDPTQSTVPVGVKIVGQNGGVADPAGTFTVTVIGENGLPVPNVDVVVDFSGDVNLCGVPFDGSTVDCGTKSATKFTDVNGNVTFIIIGGSSGGPAAVFAPEIQVFASGVLLATIPAAVFDLNNAGGVAAADISLWLTDAASGLNPTRSDFDFSGAVGAADLSILLGVAGLGGSAQSCSGVSCGM